MFVCCVLLFGSMHWVVLRIKKQQQQHFTKDENNENKAKKTWRNIRIFIYLFMLFLVSWIEQQQNSLQFQIEWSSKKESTNETSIMYIFSIIWFMKKFMKKSELKKYEKVTYIYWLQYIHTENMDRTSSEHYFIDAKERLFIVIIIFQ